MKIKNPISSSGKNNSPKKIDKNQEKICPVPVSQTSNVQPGGQESHTFIPLETQSESLSSEESVYDSCEDTLSSEESTYDFCEDADDFDDISLTKEQKCRFFQILKDLLKEPEFLTDGKVRKVRHDGKTLQLMYMTRSCEIIVQDLHGHVQFRETVPTQDIYLRWRGDDYAEPLSLENLQKVQRELKFLKILNEKANACFSKATTEFMREFECVQKNTTLKVIWDAAILTFVSGKGMNAATVAYDEYNKKPKYEMKVIWWIAFWRFLRSIYLKICEVIDSLIHVILNLGNTFTSLLKCIADWFRSWLRSQETSEYS